MFAGKFYSEHAPNCQRCYAPPEISMPIPQLNANGILPEGVHDCTLEEIRLAFASPGHSQRRRHLFREFELYVNRLRDWGWATEVHVDGSFVTGKSVPGDIDLAVCLRANYVSDAPKTETEQDLLDAQRVKRIFGFDIYYFPEDSPIREGVLFILTNDTRTPGQVRGLLRVQL